MWVRQVAWIDPGEAASRLAGLPALAFLDSAMPHPTLGRYSYLAADPFAVFTVRNGMAFWNGVAEKLVPLEALRRRLAAYPLESRDDLPPFQGGAIGYFGYEFGWSLEGRRAPVPASGDDVHLAFYDLVVAFDHQARTCRLIASGHRATTKVERERHALAQLDDVATRLSHPSLVASEPPIQPDWRAAVPSGAYRNDVERVKAYIRNGDIYQANIAQRFTGTLPDAANPFRVYRAIRDANPAPFSAYLDCGPQKILSTSPELFLRCDGRSVETRPIKGTARRVTDSVADLAVAARLIQSRKDRAENVMIVDLLRNDLAKVCVPTSVEVPVLCGLESYAGLHHLVSAVTGELASGRDVVDLIAATFPGGSITGAPKIRAMEIIAEIEVAPRGIYCGAIGWLGFDGAAALNIAIRTVTIEGGRMQLQAGGGITILSDGDAEYEETLTKAHRIFAAFAPSRALADADA